MITPYEFKEEYNLFDDGMLYINEYVKDDIIHSFFITNVTVYNYDLDNNIVDRCHGKLECYVAHPYDDCIPVKYSEYMSLAIMYKVAIYITDGEIFYQDELQDYNEFLIEIGTRPLYTYFLVRNNKGYLYLSNISQKNGGIVIEGEKDVVEQLCRYFYFVIKNTDYNGPTKDKNILFEKLFREKENAEKQQKEIDFKDNVDCNQSIKSDGLEENTIQSMQEKEVSVSILDEFNGLIGMNSLKKDVRNLISFVNMQQKRKEKGLKTVPISLHLVFTGNPGTGKTTVARILAQIYKQLGILSKGQLVEVDRASLVAGYVGQTAIKTQEKIDEAKGGILFIDEAYTLAKDGNDYGQEAIDTILKAMEDNREDFIVIVAGYPDLMENFINSNPGLKSRFNKYFYFEDYSCDELEQIFKLMCQKYDYIIEPTAEEVIKAKIYEMIVNKDKNFANARDIRNYFETIISNQASRVMMTSKCDSQDMITITKQDVYE